MEIDYKKTLLDYDIDFFKKCFSKNPSLHFSDNPPHFSQLHSLKQAHLPNLFQRMINDGYYPVNKTHFSDLLTESLIQDLKNGITNLVQNKWPASFIFLSDESWILAERAKQMMPGKDKELVCDFLAWYVDQNQSGFSPHRDRQPNDIESSFDEDGQPKYCTMWMALSNVSSENSCLMVIPAFQDPGYKKGDAIEENGQTPLELCLQKKEDYQKIKSFTGNPGNSWIFSHRIIHWGTSAPKNFENNFEPRVSISFVAASPSFEKSYLKNISKGIPSFKDRLCLIAAQMICYHERFDLNSEQLLWYYKAFSENKDIFSEDYVQKVLVEFCFGIKDRPQCEKNDQIEEILMEAMLESNWDFEEDFEARDFIENENNDDFESEEEVEIKLTDKEKELLKKFKIEKKSK